MTKPTQLVLEVIQEGSNPFQCLTSSNPVKCSVIANQPQTLLWEISAKEEKPFIRPLIWPELKSHNMWENILSSFTISYASFS